MFRLHSGRCPVACVVVLAAARLQAETPRNVIFMIGDGMGLNHVKAAGMYLNGAAGTLSFESLPYQAQVTTYSASSSVTDSAAAATAMATGYKVNNGVISMAYPGDGRELQSLLEVYKSRGARTGLVTSDAMTGATPAGFGAHESDRGNTSQIAADYLNQSRPNVLLGGGGSGMTSAAATAAGYAVVTNSSGLQGINTDVISLLSGQFGSGSMPYEYDGVGSLPHLSQMVANALDIVDNDPDGFFLLVESGNIDHAAHSNDLVRDIYETIEFHHSVQVALSWAAGRTDTLVVVTADHETGGMSAPQNQGQGNLPIVTWSTTGHTSANVGAWATGVNAQYITGTINNTGYFQIISGPDPIIALSPDTVDRAVDWARNPPSGADCFTIRNAGMGTLNYTISSDVPWVWADPASGSCTTETDTICLIYDTALLAPGVHVGHIQVADDQASNSPQLVTVTLTVNPVPGDFNDDLDVDQDDFAWLQLCYASAGTIPPLCSGADLDHDGDVDSIDFGVMHRCWSGAGNPASPACVQ